MLVVELQIDEVKYDVAGGEQGLQELWPDNDWKVPDAHTVWAPETHEEPIVQVVQLLAPDKEYLIF